jgi:hypothetical protein
VVAHGPRVTGGAVTPPLDENTARELGRAAKQAVSWTERRNQLIREAAEKGGGPREIGRAVGLSHAAIINILRPRKRGSTSDD